MELPINKKQAQRRIDRIQAFREELDMLELEGVLKLSPQARGAISHHHARLVADFNKHFDTDSTDSDRKISWGMRILTFLGGTALAASVFFFFYRVWGFLPVEIQVVVLVISPILALAGTQFAAYREKSLYYATLLAMLAYTCFVLNLHVLGSIFNINPSRNAFLVWGLFGILVAYHLGLRIILAVGLIFLLGYISSTVGSLSGPYWRYFLNRPENFILAGIALLAIPSFLPHRQFYDFTWVYHLIGLLSIFIAVLVMSYCGECSYLFVDRDILEGAYQMLGFVLAGLAIWLGIQYGLSGVTNVGVTFFTVFLYTGFFDWWWDLFPKYLFFFIISVITIGMLWAFHRIRTRLRESA